MQSLVNFIIKNINKYDITLNVNVKLFHCIVGQCQSTLGNDCVFPFGGSDKCFWDNAGAWCSTSNGGKETCRPACPIPPLDVNNHVPRGKTVNHIFLK